MPGFDDFGQGVALSVPVVFVITAGYFVSVLYQRGLEALKHSDSHPGTGGSVNTSEVVRPLVRTFDLQQPLYETVSDDGSDDSVVTVVPAPETYSQAVTRDPPQTVVRLIAQGRRMVTLLEGRTEGSSLTWKELQSLLEYNLPGGGGGGGLKNLSMREWNLEFGARGHIDVRTAPGIRVIDDLFRAQGSKQPHVSSSLAVLYERDQTSTNTLRYICVSDIDNRNTCGFLETLGRGPRIIRDRRSHEFLAVMGTRIGRLVGYTVIDAFPVRKRFIAAIHVLYINDDDTWHLRFDIGHA
ncbi:hypothetical protein N7478_011137 [Penicillium angulare]|uniref:uncharacterized protein n=1 Tax=Penicillium angulare TaxID=116970 RepID=UPI002541F827|nr:uncharacterized protein N7478_011137 [Penicillium angulare]KAJ5263532.1 hypothetical protein N7478_011137 [Penicillium angulare]